MLQATAEATRRSAAEPGVAAAMRTVYWMAKEDIPISKYPSLLNLQQLQGCLPIHTESCASPRPCRRAACSQCSKINIWPNIFKPVGELAKNMKCLAASLCLIQCGVLRYNRCPQHALYKIPYSL